MEDKITNIKERILYIAEIKSVAKEKFFDDLGLSYGNFKGKSKNTPINSNSIADISAKYPDISLEWLISGEGKMFKNADVEKNISLAAEANFYDGANWKEKYQALNEKYVRVVEENNQLLKNKLKEMLDNKSSAAV